METIVVTSRNAPRSSVSTLSTPSEPVETSAPVTSSGPCWDEPAFNQYSLEFVDPAIQRQFEEFSNPGSKFGLPWRDTKLLVITLLVIHTLRFIATYDLTPVNILLRILSAVSTITWAVVTEFPRKRSKALGISNDVLFMLFIQLPWAAYALYWTFHTPPENWPPSGQEAIATAIIPTLPMYFSSVICCALVGSVKLGSFAISINCIISMGALARCEPAQTPGIGYTFAFMLLCISFQRKIKVLNHRTFIHVLNLEKSNQAAAIAHELAQLIETANAPIIGVDTDGLVNKWNVKTTQITGFSAEEAMGKHLVQTFIELESRTAVQQVLTRALNGIETANYELVFKTKAGDMRTLLLNATTRRDSEGNIIGVVGVAQDVTELIASKSSAAANKERADAEKTMNEYLAHEVRNPLSVAIMGTDLLIRQSDQQGQASDQSVQNQTSRLDDADQLRMIASNLAFILDLLSNMLDTNKFMTGKLELMPSPIYDLKEQVILPVVEMLRSRHAELPVRFVCPDGLSMMGDVIRLKQVLVNLGANSLKFTNNGYIEILVEAVSESSATTPGSNGASPGQRTVVISVQDTGPGISHNKEDLIFTKYQQLNSHVQGTGIGLYLCHSLVTCMGGQICLDRTFVPDDPGNQYGPGCCFKITLPITSIDETSAGRLLAANAAGGNINARPSAGSAPGSPLQSARRLRSFLHRGLRVLIVDDNKIILKTLAKQIQAISTDWVIDTAIHGEQAIQLLQQGHEYDIITMDHFMSESGGVMTGDQTIRAMRAQEATSIIVGSSGNDLSAAHLEAGADLFWRKPIPFKQGQCQLELHTLLVQRVGLPRTWTVLVADDQRLNRKLLRRKLQSLGDWASGWAFLEASSGEEALQMSRSHDVDMVLLDEYMDDQLRGSSVARAIRAGSEHPLLISVSGMDMLEDESMKGVFDLVWRKPIPTNAEMTRQLGEAWSGRGAMREEGSGQGGGEQG